VKQFFDDFEHKYSKEIPTFSGDYTEYWTDGVSSGARETAKNRNSSEVLKQADAIWAIRKLPNYPYADFNESWKNMLLFNEHTWGAYNSTDEPDNDKVRSQWKYKQAFALNAERKTDSLLKVALVPSNPKEGFIDVYNTNSWVRTDVVIVPARLSKAGDLVKDNTGKKVPSQRLSNGELAFIAYNVPEFGKSTFSISKGRAFNDRKGVITNKMINNGLYTVVLNSKTGDITKLIKDGRNYVSDTTAINQYIYMPGDLLKNITSSSQANISIKEKGPLVYSLLVKSGAPGTNGLEREIRLVQGIDRLELINTIDKTAIREKESVHFAFPFSIPGAQIRYNIPWASVTAESDQLPNSNHNWYTMQRWVDISNAEFGLTWSSPDAPLFEIGKINTANLLGGLHHSPNWINFTPQSSVIYSWVMNNLWHTNFKADQEGKTTFRYYIQGHQGAYNAFKANQAGINDHQPLLVAAASIENHTSLNIKGQNVYTEVFKVSNDGKAFIVVIVNDGDTESKTNITFGKDDHNEIWESNLQEDKVKKLGQTFQIPAKGIMTIRFEKQ
jgi:alpha-mannosidase